MKFWWDVGYMEQKHQHRHHPQRPHHDYLPGFSAGDGSICEWVSERLTKLTSPSVSFFLPSLSLEDLLIPPGWWLYKADFIMQKRSCSVSRQGTFPFFSFFLPWLKSKNKSERNVSSWLAMPCHASQACHFSYGDLVSHHYYFHVWMHT